MQALACVSCPPWTWKAYAAEGCVGWGESQLPLVSKPQTRSGPQFPNLLNEGNVVHGGVVRVINSSTGISFLIYGSSCFNMFSLAIPCSRLKKGKVIGRGTSLLSTYHGWVITSALESFW